MGCGCVWLHLWWARHELLRGCAVRGKLGVCLVEHRPGWHIPGGMHLWLRRVRLSTWWHLRVQLDVASGCWEGMPWGRPCERPALYVRGQLAHRAHGWQQN